MNTLFLDIISQIVELDKFLISKVNGQWHNAIFDFIIPYIRERFFWFPFYFLLIVLIFKTYKKHGYQMVFTIILTAVIANTVSSEWIKKSVQRLRPCNEPTIETRTVPGVHCGGGYSFTSSHATNHFAGAVSIALIVPAVRRRRLWIFGLLFWAAFISFGQAYVGVHYPSDLICGAILGSTIAFLFYKLYGFLQRKKLFLPTTDF